MVQQYFDSNWGHANICVNRNRVKNYDGNIYLQDKQEFEIELYNPTDTTKCAQIAMNGKPISSGGLVIKPGQRVYLERFLDVAKKFIFETYKTDDSAESQWATRNNGVVTISFYDEQTPPPPPITTISYNSGRFDLTNSGTGGAYYNSLGNTVNTSYTEKGTSQKLRSASRGIGGASCDSMSFCSNEVPDEKFRDEVETGRIEQGAYSDQKFVNYTGKFNYHATNTVRFKLLPLSAKPIEVSDLAVYCVECGSKNKGGKFKYCPKCGKKF